MLPPNWGLGGEIVKKWALVLLLVLAGCQTDGGGGTASGARAERLFAQVSAFYADPAIARWVANEAASAGVSDIRYFGPGEGAGIYGMARSDSGDVLIQNSAAGRSLTNVTHEIAHIAAYRRDCFAHGRDWVEYLMAMAVRFEAAFPGQRWGTVTPTQSVQEKYTRYASELNEC